MITKITPSIFALTTILISINYSNSFADSRFNRQVAEDIITDMWNENVQEESKKKSDEESLEYACSLNQSSGTLNHLACSYVFKNILPETAKIYEKKRDLEGRLQFGNTYSNDYKSCIDMMEINYKYICKSYRESSSGI